MSETTELRAGEARLNQISPVESSPKETRMKKTGLRRRLASLAAAALLLPVLLLMGPSCSSEEAGGTTADLMSSTTAPSDAVPTPGTAGTSTTATTTGSLLSEWDRQLRDNAKIQHALAVYLTDLGADETDPQMALYYGLQARTRALTCRKALAQDDLELADTAMLDVYHALNLARNVAAGSLAEILADAHAVVETLGTPSDAPAEAAPILDRFLEATAPLVEEANALLSSTSSS